MNHKAQCFYIPYKTKLFILVLCSCATYYVGYCLVYYITWFAISLGLLYHLVCYITWFTISLGLLYHLVCYITWFAISLGLLYHLVYYITWFPGSLMCIYQVLHFSLQARAKGEVRGTSEK